MSTISVKVNARHQITIPQIAREKLSIKKGDRLLLDVQDRVIVLMPEPKRYADHLQGLYAEIWRGIDVQKYVNGERKTWTNAAQG